MTELHSQVPAGVLVAGTERIRLSWRVAEATTGQAQHAYEIEVSRTEGFEAVMATTGVVEGAAQVAVPAPGSSLESREVRFYRVRIRTNEGWTAWGPTLRVEAGLLRGSDWVARAVTLPDDPGRERKSPSPVLRRVFAVSGRVARARLYATAMGTYDLKLNGETVGDALLSPGWTAYRHRLVADTYDVTSMVRSGDNVLAATLGDGWYRGRLGWTPDNDRAHYGREVGLVAQLEIMLDDGTVHLVVTDDAWMASTAEVRTADLYDGSVIDLRERREGMHLPGYDTSGWQPAAIVPLDPGLIEPRMAEPVRVVETIPAGPLPEPLPDGTLRLDAGQNIAGFVRLRVQGSRDDEVVVRHAEVLEPDGSLHTRSLRSARATDTYVLAEGSVTVLEPAFTFHGFRYAEIRTHATVLEAEFVAISSDTARRGWFECSDPLLSRFHENVVWSQRDNFVSVPTDCPQRDERLGWSGDAQAFAPTACTLFDVRAFWESWLSDLALDQDDDLGVPTVVPDVVLRGESRYGRAGWADAATMVPWAVYEAYGDADVLRRQLPSMRRHVESLRSRQGPDGLLPDSMQFGDWLDPDAPIDRPWEAKADSTYLANAYFAHSARLLAGSAAILGEDDTRTVYDRVAGDVAAATWQRWAAHALETQTGAAVALCFGLAPEPERTAVANALARLVRDVDGRVATGFLGTPLVLPALAMAGHYDEAYLMLLRTGMPSWLYQVAQGATTVWERWDAIRPDGSIHPGTMTPPPEMPDSDRDDGAHMLSFNHYAYGAVVDWIYRHLAGLAPDIEQPGYRNVILAPRPVRGIDRVRASVETAYGTVAIAWRLDDETFTADIELPFGTSGTFRPPTTPRSRVTLDGGEVAAVVVLEPGRHRLTVSMPVVADPRVAHAT